MKSARPRPNVPLLGCGPPLRGIVNEAIPHLQSSKHVRAAVCLNDIQRIFLRHQEVGVCCKSVSMLAASKQLASSHLILPGTNSPKLCAILILLERRSRLEGRHSEKSRTSTWKLSVQFSALSLVEFLSISKFKGLSLTLIRDNTSDRYVSSGLDPRFN